MKASALANPLRLAFLAVSSALALASCDQSKSPDDQFAKTLLKPGEVPTQLQLNAKAEAVVVITIRASDAGYQIVNTRQMLGTPTMGIDKSRDVLITAQNSSGQALATISVFNPRVIRTTGARNPATDVLSDATFSIALPAATQKISITVRSGPNEKLTSTLPLPRSDEPQPPI